MIFRSSQHSISIPKTARYYTLGSENASSIWIVLHGYGQLASSFIKDFQSIAGEDRLVVAPEGLSRFYLRAGQGPIGANWMTSEDRENEIADYLTYLDTVTARVVRNPSQRVFAFGFSQGSATACRWFAHSKHVLSGLVVWAGGIPPDLDLESTRKRLGQRPIRFTVGDEDQFMPQHRFKAEIEFLEQNDIPVVANTFAGKHRIDDVVLVDEIAAVESTT